MQSTSDEIVGKLDPNSYKSEMKRISSEIPDPAFGYLRGSSAGYQRKDDTLRGNLVDGDLGNLVYLAHYGQNDREMTLMGQKSQCICRYHMRYTRGWASSEDRWVKIPTLLIDKVAIQGDILEGSWESFVIIMKIEKRFNKSWIWSKTDGDLSEAGAALSKAIGRY